MFQGWRFQRWRQASLWTAKKIRRQRIRGITRRRAESNARGACRIIEGNSTNRFCTIESHGNEPKQENWVPYELKPRDDFERRFFTCEQLIQRQQRKSFLHRIVTGDEEWIFYDNPKKKKYYAWSIVAINFNINTMADDSKIMLCIWWNQKDLVYYELLKPGDFITDDRYRLQLIRLSRALREKRPEYEQRHNKVILLHDNARPYVAKVVKKYLGCFTTPAVFSGHCSFWLLVAPKDAASHRFTPFAEIENWIENWLQNWIASKTSHFFEMEFENCLRDGKK